MRGGLLLQVLQLRSLSRAPNSKQNRPRCALHFRLQELLQFEATWPLHASMVEPQPDEQREEEQSVLNNVSVGANHGGDE